jgi:Cytochrome P450
MTPPLVLSDRVPSGCLARFPEQFAKLRTDPGLARTAFGEAVRYETPVQTFFRTTTRPVEIHGIELGKGEKVLMFLGAANRDPRRWVRPDESRHLSAHDRPCWLRKRHPSMRRLAVGAARRRMHADTVHRRDAGHQGVAMPVLVTEGASETRARHEMPVLTSLGLRAAAAGRLHSAIAGGLTPDSAAFVPRSGSHYFDWT